MKKIEIISVGCCHTQERRQSKRGCHLTCFGHTHDGSYELYLCLTAIVCKSAVFSLRCHSSNECNGSVYGGSVYNGSQCLRWFNIIVHTAIIHMMTSIVSAIVCMMAWCMMAVYHHRHWLLSCASFFTLPFIYCYFRYYLSCCVF